MSNNAFLLEQEEYQRSISPIRDWMRQTAKYASVMLDKNYEDCLVHVEKKFKAKLVPFHDPHVVHFARGENGDKFRAQTPLSRYINNIVRGGHVLAPTGTVYLHADRVKSNIVGYQDVNVAQRSRYKKLSQKYEQEGNDDLYLLYHNFQDCKKRRNNAVSGLFSAEGSPIKNTSAHSTLTSTTRSMSSLSNASNERVIEGNRHYYSPQIALNNLISIVTDLDTRIIDDAIQTYGLKYPTVEETIACVNRSLDLYDISRRGSETVDTFIRKLTPTERAAIVYTGDLYHLRVLNEDVIYELVTDLSQKGAISQIEDVVKGIYGFDEAILNYACQTNLHMLEGKAKDYKEKLTPEEQSILFNTCQNVLNAIEKYRLLFKAFFLTKNAPCTISTIASQVRRTVMLSDTDSTMFSTDSWVFWYFEKANQRDNANLSKKDLFTDKGYAIGGSIMFIATQCIGHMLALFSANMNVERSRLFSLQMKPEYVFPVFALTSIAKHYYTAMKVKEGNVYKDIKMEIKGVHMKDSTVPKNIVDTAAEMMENNIRSLMAGEDLSLIDAIRKVVDIEQEIIRSLRSGEVEYLKRTTIKEAAAYKKEPHQSPYQNYVMWNRCFASAYGQAPELPYRAFYVPLKMKNKTDRDKWINGIRNQEVAQALRQYFHETGKSAMTTFPVPLDVIQSHGIPQELMDGLDLERVVLSLTKSLRNTLESMAFFPKFDKLVSSHVLQPHQVGI